MTSCSAFRCAGRGPAVTHPSTEPTEKLLDLGDRLAPDTYHTPNTLVYEFIILYMVKGFYFVMNIVNFIKKKWPDFHQLLRLSTE